MPSNIPYDPDTEELLKKNINPASLPPTSSDDDSDDEDDTDQPQQAAAPTPQPTGAVQSAVAQAKQQAAGIASAIAKPTQAGNKAIVDKPDYGEVKTLMDQLQKVKMMVPETEKPDWDAKLQQAKDLYKDQTNRNDWAEVAQTIGKAAAQFGASASNLGGRHDVSGLQIPGINYENRNERALREYQTNVGELENERRSAHEQALENLRQGELGYEQQYKPLSEALKTAQERAGIQQRGYQEGQLEQPRLQAAEAYRESQRDLMMGKFNQTEADKQARAQGQANAAQQKPLQDQAVAASTAASLYDNYDKLDKKGKAAADTKAAQLLGKAGLSPAEMDDIDKKASEGSGILGMFQSPDPKKKAALIMQNEHVQSLMQGLDQLRQQRASNASQVGNMNRGSTAGGNTQQPAAQPQAAGPKPGDIEGGHRFLGGNPADPKNWEVVK